MINTANIPRYTSGQIFQDIQVANEYEQEIATLTKMTKMSK